ncbi:ABC transporter permease [Streptomyces sp. NPDC051041]|uniref:ABC transporter permease n=1 Tax=Streptomyces sp. NPDC051041 TaxID=3365640 RepID=UPI0037AD42D5
MSGSGHDDHGRLLPARLRPFDLMQLSLAGLRAKPLRAVLSAAGISIGIAAMVAVVGISSSSRAGLQFTLDRLGTNLLRVSAGQDFYGGRTQLPRESLGMARRVPSVTGGSATGDVDANVYRTDLIPPEETNSLKVMAARTDLLTTLGARTASGTWLNRAVSRYPGVVLGSVAAQRLGVVRADPGVRIWLGERWFTVVGVLEPVVLAPELDSAALVGFDVAERVLGFDGHPSMLYIRSDDRAVSNVWRLLARSVNPGSPETVEVSRPSDALAAKLAAEEAFTGLLLGVGAVALLVGGIGVANTMVITVLERRTEIGLRRALGATRGQIRTQFFTESLLLAALGGLGGALLGTLVTTAYAAHRHWPLSLPAEALAAGVGGTLVIGALAGLYPAVRAAQVSPVTALSSG